MVERLQIPSGELTFCHGKSPFLIGKPSINGPFSIAMLVHQRVNLEHFCLSLLVRAGGSRTLELLAIEDEGVSDNAPHLENLGRHFSLWICLALCPEMGYTVFLVCIYIYIYMDIDRLD